MRPDNLLLTENYVLAKGIAVSEKRYILIVRIQFYYVMSLVVLLFLYILETGSSLITSMKVFHHTR